jgi:hypothetical protein
MSKSRLTPKYVKARQEAERFLAALKELEAKADAEDPSLTIRGWPQVIWHGGKETAAVKRASLDLTRALAEMRKP